MLSHLDPLIFIIGPTAPVYLGHPRILKLQQNYTTEVVTCSFKQLKSKTFLHSLFKTTLGWSKTKLVD